MMLKNSEGGKVQRNKEKYYQNNANMNSSIHKYRKYMKIAEWKQRMNPAEAAPTCKVLITWIFFYWIQLIFDECCKELKDASERTVNESKEHGKCWRLQSSILPPITGTSTDKQHSVILAKH